MENLDDCLVKHDNGDVIIDLNQNTVFNQHIAP